MYLTKKMRNMKCFPGQVIPPKGASTSFGSALPVTVTCAVGSTLVLNM